MPAQALFYSVVNESGRGPDPTWAEEATDASRCSPAELPGSGLNVGKVGGR